MKEKTLKLETVDIDVIKFTLLFTKRYVRDEDYTLLVQPNDLKNTLKKFRDAGL